MGLSIDRDKVIKGLEICTKDIPMSNAVHKSDLCKECPYYNAKYSYCWNQIVMMRDALDLLKEQDDLGAELTNAVELIHKKNERIKELLKEQEAVPVIQREVMHMLVWCCGSCGVAITDGDKFCRNCGKKMKRCE